MYDVCFFNDTATTEIYTLSLHDALPISKTTSEPTTSRTRGRRLTCTPMPLAARTSSSMSSDGRTCGSMRTRSARVRSEEHTSELQSRQYLVCRLLLEKKNHQPSITLRHT